MRTKIGVLLSTYNGSRYLEELLESINGQINVEIAIFARDDGSKDDRRTLRILYEFKERNPNVEMHVIEGENVGSMRSFSFLVPEALNFDIDYFAFADQDDVWLPNKLEEALKAIISIQKEYGRDVPIMYYSNLQTVDYDLHPLNLTWGKEVKAQDKHNILIQNRAFGCTTLFNRKAAQIYVEKFNEKFHVHDYLLHLICIYFGRVYYDTNSFILYRQHNSNQIGKPGLMTRWRRRIGMRWYRGHESETVAKTFLNEFDDCLSDSDKNIVKKVAYYRRSLKNRFSLLIDKRFRKITFEENLILYIKILFGII